MMKWRENGKMKRKWRKIHSLQFLILSLFTPSLSISYIEICHSLAENVRYGSFVTNVTRKLNRKLVWVEFAARKPRKLCRPGSTYLLNIIVLRNVGEAEKLEAWYLSQ